MSDQPTPLELAAASLDAPAGAWLDAYLDLKAAGLTWKRAAFAAWVNAPKSARQPRTMKELAALLNLKSEQIFYRWQQEAWFRDSGIDKLRQLCLLVEQAKLAQPVEVDLPVDSNFERALLAAYGVSMPHQTEIKENDSDQNDAQI